MHAERKESPSALSASSSLGERDILTTETSKLYGKESSHETRDSSDNA